jgi:hypothetical protein
MSESDLPPDLLALEHRLADLARPQPSPELGPRVLAAVRDVLGERPRPTGWGFWAAVAAALLLGINLSMSLVADTDWDLAPGAEPGRQAAEDWLRELAPDLPDSEIRRQRLLVRAGADLAPIVPLNLNRQPIPPGEERDRWDVR